MRALVPWPSPRPRTQVRLDERYLSHRPGGPDVPVQHVQPALPIPGVPEPGQRQVRMKVVRIGFDAGFRGRGAASHSHVAQTIDGGLGCLNADTEHPRASPPRKGDAIGQPQHEGPTAAGHPAQPRGQLAEPLGRHLREEGERHVPVLGQRAAQGMVAGAPDPDPHVEIVDDILGRNERREHAHADMLPPPTRWSGDYSLDVDATMNP